MSERTAWRICSDNGWWSAFGKKRGKSKKAGPPVHDDLCAVTDDKGRTRHEFTADAPNRLWLSDITEHATGEGKLYLCAGQGRLFQPNRGLLDRLADEVTYRRGRAQQCGGQARGGGRLCPAHRSRVAIQEPETRPCPESSWHDRGSMGRVGACSLPSSS